MSAPDPLHLLRLQFVEVARHRPWALLSPFVEYDEVNPPAPSPGSLADLGSGPRAPYCALVGEVAAADGVLRLGLAGGATSVLGSYDAVAGLVAIDITSSRGSLTLPAPVEVRAPFGFAVVVNSNHVTVLVRPAGGDWYPAITDSDRIREFVDLRDPLVLTDLRYVHGVEGSACLGRLQAGYFGQVGVRDPQVVRTADGEPLVRDGKLWLTLTNAGLGFFSYAHWGVWTLDLADPTRLEQVGALFFARDGVVLGDHAGQLIVDEGTGRTTVVVSSWGDFSPEAGVHIRHLITDEDLLAGVHVLKSQRALLPSPHSTWDPSLARVDGRWHLAFVECTTFGPPRFAFHPALARTDDQEPLVGLVRVGADEALEQTEGTILQRIEGRWFIFASDRDASEYPVYEVTAMERVGMLQAPYGSNIPHPMIVPNGRPGQATWWLLAFDGTPWNDTTLGYGTHGDFIVMAAQQVSERARQDGRRIQRALRRLTRS